MDNCPLVGGVVPLSTRNLKLSMEQLGKMGKDRNTSAHLTSSLPLQASHTTLRSLRIHN
jgi:hypothetical protein